MNTPAPFSERQRRALLAKVHIGKKALGLDAMEWVVYLRDMTGKSSSRELDETELKDLVKRMEQRGIVFAKPQRATAQRPRLLDSSSLRAGQVSKIEALLAEQRLPWAYAHAIAKRMFHKDRVDLCDGSELHAVITALIKRGAHQSAPKGG